MKERMLLCLKYVGRMSRANVSGSLITNESPFGVHWMQWSVVFAETIWKSLVRKGAARGAACCVELAAAAAVWGGIDPGTSSRIGAGTGAGSGTGAGARKRAMITPK